MRHKKKIMTTLASIGLLYIYDQSPVLHAEPTHKPSHHHTRMFTPRMTDPWEESCPQGYYDQFKGHSILICPVSRSIKGDV